jgi:hypothetical protein
MGKLACMTQMSSVTPGPLVPVSFEWMVPNLCNLNSSHTFSLAFSNFFGIFAICILYFRELMIVSFFYHHSALDWRKLHLNITPNNHAPTLQILSLVPISRIHDVNKDWERRRRVISHALRQGIQIFIYKKWVVGDLNHTILDSYI